MDIEPCDTLEERGTPLGYNHRRPSEQQNLRLQNANNHVLRWPQQQSYGNIEFTTRKINLATLHSES